MFRVVFGFLLFFTLTPVTLFLTAGTLTWPEAWAFLFMWAVSILVSRWIAWRRFPDLLRERAQAMRAEGAQRGDRILASAVGLLGPLAIVLVAGLDRRLGWSPEIPPLWRWLAAFGVGWGYALGVWAMAVNPYFSAVARLQDDRGQVVVDWGPYRWVRHPAYAGGLLAVICMSIMLDAPWALIPAAPVVGSLIVRTAREDVMLAEGLEGYREYMEKTRSRLIPYLW